jgi:adenylate cyclase
MAEDEAATVRTLGDYREEIALLVRQHRGRVVDTAGDSLLAEFPTALEAVRAAVEIQRVIQVRNADLSPERRMQFRMGVHLGDVMVEGGRIYGDGVNIAARLQALAEPGGICISAEVHGQVRHKLDIEYADLGEQRVKNIPDPVHVYRIQVEAATLPSVEPRLGPRTLAAAGAVLVLAVAGWLLWQLGARRSPAPEASIPLADLEAAATGEHFTVPGFGSAPAIAVLAFDNLSGDPEQEYFADGIAEELINRLSAFRSLPVIARNSSFTYKGKAVNVTQVSRELGARYIVEGSVRRAGGRVRISAQLIDATIGHHVWAETYDRELQDIFAVQDEITEAIAGSLGWAWRVSEAKHAMHKDPRDLDAYDLTMRGFWHLRRSTAEDNRKARALFERAIEIDPQHPLPFALLANAHYSDNLFQWTDSPTRSLAEQFRAAERCLKLDPAWGLCHWTLAWAWSLTGQRDKALAAAELAVELAPSFPLAHQTLGLFLAVTGHPERGIAHQQKAMRLSPLSPMMSYYLHCIALAHFAAERYEEAVRWEQRALQRKPDYWISLGTLASSYAHLGREDDARSAVWKMIESNPESSAEAFTMIFSVADAAFIEAWLDGLRKVGWEG